jgi:molybdate transport system substrate-binding protein
MVMVLGCSVSSKKPLTIATAANMQFALTEITEAFTEDTGIKTETILGSSGKLNAQIKEGAPYDVFVSADMAFPQDLYESGFTKSAPKVYANGTLILWSFQDQIEPSFELLTDPNIKHIAIANPKTAPYGIAASQVLKEGEYYDQIVGKLVFGESVGQTNQFIITGAAEVGLTAKSVVMSPQMKGKGNWVEVSSSLHDPILQGMVLLKTEEITRKNAQLFSDFMFSEKAKTILRKYGYQVP